MMTVHHKLPATQPAMPRPRSPDRPRRWRVAITAPVTVAAILFGTLVLAACANPPLDDHGQVVAHLSIPFQSAAGKVDIIAVSVAAGRRFSIKVDTSDGPSWWSQAAPPDPRLIRLVGNYDDGSCPQDLTGCRVPYFHTLFARATGTTTMTWKYYDESCRAETGSTPPPSPCPRVAVVRFDITIR
jgi:hypothetical protein